MSFALITYGILIGVLLGGSANGEDDPYQHAVELLSKHPLIDGYYVSRAYILISYLPSELREPFRYFPDSDITLYLCMISPHK